MNERSLLAPNISPSLENDDYLEKKKNHLRRQTENELEGSINSFYLSPSSSVSRRKSLKNSLMSNGLTHEQLREIYSSCIKLSSENKINVKNAFGLQLIDYMQDLISSEQRKETTPNFQVAGCTLDASVKIYSYRVDSVHSDAVKIAGSLGHDDPNSAKSATNDDDPLNDQDAATYDNPADFIDDNDDFDNPRKLATKKSTKRAKSGLFKKKIEANLRNITSQANQELDVGSSDLADPWDSLNNNIFVSNAGSNGGGNVINMLLVNNYSVNSDNFEIEIDPRTVIDPAVKFDPSVPELIDVRECRRSALQDAVHFFKEHIVSLPTFPFFGELENFSFKTRPKIPTKDTADDDSLKKEDMEEIDFLTQIDHEKLTNGFKNYSPPDQYIEEQNQFHQAIQDRIKHIYSGVTDLYDSMEQKLDLEQSILNFNSSPDNYCNSLNSQDMERSIRELLADADQEAPQPDDPADSTDGEYYDVVTGPDDLGAENPTDELDMDDPLNQANKSLIQFEFPDQELALVDEAGTNKETTAVIPHNMTGGINLELSLEPNEYSYFNHIVNTSTNNLKLSTMWQGPSHWRHLINNNSNIDPKLKKILLNTTNVLSKKFKNRKRKLNLKDENATACLTNDDESVFVDFLADDEDRVVAAFKTAKATATSLKSVTCGNVLQNLNFTENNKPVSIKRLFQLFLMPSVKLCRSSGADNVEINIELDQSNLYDYDNDNDRLNYCSGVVNKPPTISQEIENPDYKYMDDDMDPYADGGDDLASLSPSIAAATNKTNGCVEYGNAELEKELKNMNDLIANHGNSTRPGGIEYAKVARSFDTKKIKTTLWSLLKPKKKNAKLELSSITASDEKKNAKLELSSITASDEKIAEQEANDEKIKTVPEEPEPNQINKFSDIYVKMKSSLPVKTRQNVSIQVALACLLHLANEKSLILTGNSDMTNIDVESMQTSNN